jgi:putative ABC transport system permease protein
MRAARQIGLRLRSVFLHRRVERELDEELRYHLEREIEMRVAAGKPQEEARFAALRIMEGIAQQQEACRDMRGTAWVETTIQDLEYAWRTLRHRPFFSAVVILTLAVGIGANAAIFSLVNGVVLRPFPYPALERLVDITELDTVGRNISVSWQDFQDWRVQVHGLTSLAAMQGRNVTLTGRGQAERMQVMRVSAPFFSLLGVRPLLGRDFQESDDRAGAAPTVLISHSLWQTRFGGDPHAVGRGADLDGVSYTIVGVLPAFPTPYPADLYLPIGMNGDQEMGGRGNHPGIEVLARLRSGVSPADAGREMRDIARRLQQQYPETNSGVSAGVRRFTDSVIGPARGSLFSLWGAVALVLLIACANVASLLLARAAARDREIAIRAAMGAGRGRILRQLLTESLLLAVLGSIAGLGLAWAIRPLILAVLPADIRLFARIPLDGYAIGFTALLAIVTTVLFGLAPALRLARHDPDRTLRAGGRVASAGFRGFSMRGLLVAGQVALAFVLLAGAGLLIKSLVRLSEVDPGFRTDHVLTMRLRLPAAGYPTVAKQTAFADEVWRRIRAIPGVVGASGVFCLPLDPNGCWASIFLIDGRPLPRRDDLPNALFNAVGPDYLRSLGARLIEGREFDERDGPGTPLVLLVNQAFARKYFPNEDPVGKRIKQGYPEDKTPYATIVGVMGDVRRQELDHAAQPEAFQAIRQAGPDFMNVLVRTSLPDPASLVRAIREEVASLDPGIPLFEIRTMDYYLDAQQAGRRFPMLLLSAFAALALFLAGIGLYGLLGFLVTQRTPEIGIRLALGAQAASVTVMMLQQGACLVIGGLAAGIVASLATTRLLSSLLFGVPPRDWPTLAAAAAALALAGALACWLPSRRAARIDVLTALRAE